MRYLFRAISLLLLLACLLTVAAWVRSHWVMDEWSMANEDGQVVAIVSYQGAIHHTRSGDRAAPRRWSYDSHRIADGMTWANLYTTPGRIDRQFAGFVRLRSTRIAAGPPFGATGAAAPNQGSAIVRQTMAPWLITLPYDAWTAPYWALAATAGAVPGLWLARGVRRVYRRRRGRCAGCGYDLRASAGRCPECGAVFKVNRRNAAPVAASPPSERST